MMFQQVFKGRNLQILTAFLASFGFFGLALGYLWPSPGILKLMGNDPSIHVHEITEGEANIMISFCILALFVATIILVQVNKRIVRRTILQLAPIPMIISWVLVLYGNHIWYFYVARILAGSCEAFYYFSAPAYISEIADPEIRGILGNLIPIMLNLGGVVVFWLGYIWSTRVFALTALIPLILCLSFSLFLPPSPYQYFATEEYEKAKDYLKLFRGDRFSDSEFENIKSTLQLEKKGSVKGLFENPAATKAMIIVFIQSFFQQASGTYTIINYTHYILNKGGIEDITIPATIVGIVSVPSSICTFFLIDRFGRRMTMMLSYSAIALIYFLLAGYFCYWKGQFTWSLTSLLTGFTYFANLGVLNVSSMLASEMFPSNLRGYGSGIFLGTYGFVGLLANTVFELIVCRFGMECMFGGFGMVAVAGFLWTYFYLPETKNKSLLEIQQILEGENSVKMSLGIKEKTHL